MTESGTVDPEIAGTQNLVLRMVSAALADSVAEQDEALGVETAVLELGTPDARAAVFRFMARWIADDLKIGLGSAVAARAEVTKARDRAMQTLLDQED